MFWKRKSANGQQPINKLPGHEGIPEQVGRHMVIQMRQDPDWVWKLRGVCRPTDKKRVFYCRIFDEGQTRQAGLKVKDWTSLEERPDLILWEGYFDKEHNIACPEKYAPSQSTN